MLFLVILGNCFIGLFALVFDGLVVWVLGLVVESFVAKVYARGKITVPLVVREVLNLEDGDYVRVTVTEVIRRKQERKEKKGRKN